ncbi:MAG: hypothetical protein GXO27_05470, partial [Chlorobi bacterium]|nr:hypothetical protein [Chlorobiota bacterium]
VPGSGRRLAWTAGAEYQWHRSIHIWAAGIELMHNAAYGEYLRWLDIAYGTFGGRPPSAYRIAVTGGHLYKMGRLRIYTGLGVYIYDPARLYAPFYLRPGIRYYPFRRWGVGISLKTHYFAAEQADLTLFYKFKF